MWILSPLKKNRNLRYLYCGQFISFFGTMMSLVAIPYQIYQLTKSTLLVGLIGVFELLPLLLTAFIGGILADRFDRKKLLLYSEIGMTIGCFLLMLNALTPHPQVWFIFLIATFNSAFNGIHTPALNATLPRLVAPDEIQSISVLGSLKHTVGMIGGPAVAGVCITEFGLFWTYALDLCTFLLSLFAITQIQSVSASKPKEPPSLKHIYEAIRYATKRGELLGTYVVDFAAMVFAMPNALFPAIAQTFTGSKILGWLYSAPAIGALIVTLTSSWIKRIQYHGRAVALAAMSWGLAIVLLGQSTELIWILFFLILAGGADGISGIFRSTIWNETIPDHIRGRMASLEMISYLSGPLLGNAQAGFLASQIGVQNAITMGGTLCMVGIFLCVLLLPAFWGYHKTRSIPQSEINLA